MRPNSAPVVSNTGNLLVEDNTRFSLAEESLDHIMSLLTNLYKRPDLAVIREYSTNALDSHMAAGIIDPIEIFLPTRLAPTFIVKDHGVGLSVDQIRDQFSKYGWSSKRGDNDQSGTLGLGCKSALTYSDQFVFVAVQNGVKSTVLVTRDEKGVGVLNTVSTIDTDEPNGVEVQIPVKDVYSFNITALEFFKFWDIGTVLVDRKSPVSVWENEKSLPLDEDMIVLPDKSQSYVVMGNVPYEVSIPNLEVSVIVRVPMGSVTFPPNRETVSYTPLTKDTLKEISDFVKSRLKNYIQDDINSAKNEFEAVNKYIRWTPFLGVGRRNGVFVSSVTYRGNTIPSQLFGKGIIYKPNSYRGDKVSKFTYLNTVDFANMEKPPIGYQSNRVLYVTGYNNGGVTQLLRDSINEWAANNARPQSVVLTEDDFWSPWINPKYVVDYEDLKVKRVNTTVKPQGWRVNRNSRIDRVEDLDDLDLTNCCWTTSSEYGLKNVSALQQLLNSAVIIVPNHRVKTFKKSYGQIEEFDIFASKKASKFLNDWTRADCVDHRHFHAWTATDLKDPDLHEFCGGNPAKIDRARTAAALLGVYVALPKNLLDSVALRYPLIYTLGGTNRRFVAQYLNDTYIAQSLQNEEH